MLRLSEQLERPDNGYWADVNQTEDSPLPLGIDQRKSGLILFPPSVFRFLMQKTLFKMLLTISNLPEERYRF